MSNCILPVCLIAFACICDRLSLTTTSKQSHKTFIQFFTSGQRRSSPLTQSRDPRCYLCSECCSGSRSMAAPRANLLAPTDWRPSI